MKAWFNSLSDNNQALAVIMLASIFHAIYNIFIPMNGDEAYYWFWALKPSLSYYDHPAMIAWVIYPFTLLPDHVFFVRLSTVICMSVTLYYLFRLTYDIAGKRAGWYVLIMFSVLPAVWLGYMIVTIDSPLMAFWAAAQYYTYKAIETDKTKYFIIAGILTGCTMLSKYTGILFPVGVFIFILIRRRDLLKDVRLWLTVLIAAIVVMPIFIWNYYHEWISITFQYKHGTTSSFEIDFNDFAELVLGSLLILMPILSYILIRYIFDKKRWWRDDAKLYLMALTLFPLLFFFYKGLFARMELNWIIVAFMAGGVLTAIAAVEYDMKRTFKYGCILALVISVLFRLMPFLPLPENLSYSYRLYGYKEAVEYVNKLLGPDDVIFSDHLTTASLLHFYSDRRDVYIPVDSRFSQFDIWHKQELDEPYLAKSGYYVGKSDRGAELATKYDNVTLIEHLDIQLENGANQQFYVYKVEARKN